MFGFLFKKKAPNKAGIAYQKVKSILEKEYKLSHLSGHDGAESSWEVRGKETGKFYFFLSVWGIQGASPVPCKGEDAEQLFVQMQSLWSGKKAALANKLSVEEAIRPYRFHLADWESREQDWEFVGDFTLQLEPSEQDLLDQAHAFYEAVERAYKILESK